MGICFTRTYRKHSVSTGSLSTFQCLQTLKENLIYQIFRLHSLVLICRAHVESFLIEGKKNNALIYKVKEVVIRKKLRDLRELIRAVDELEFMNRLDKIVENNILNEGRWILKDLQSNIYTNEPSCQPDSGTIQNDSIPKDLAEFGLNSTEISEELEQEFQKIQKNQKTDFKRKRFSKGLKSLA